MQPSENTAADIVPERNPLWWTSPLYFAQGLPYGVVMMMAPIYFTDQGASLESIGLLSLLGLPWSFKALYSPLIDLLGKRRSWVLITLALLFASILALSFFTADVPQAGSGLAPELKIATALLFLIAIFSATSDTAQDAFYMDALSEKQQALFLGPRVTAYRIAMLVCSGGLVYLAGHLGWKVGFQLSAVLMGSAAFWCFSTLPYPESPREIHRGQGEFWKEFARAFVSYFQQERPLVILLFIVTYKLGEQMLGKMTTPFLMNECGMTTSDMGLITGFVGIGATILGAIGASFWLARRSLFAALVAITLIMNGTDLLYFMLVNLPDRPFWLVASVNGVESLSAGMGTAAYAYLLIRTCKQNFRATHYAIATGLMSLGGTVAPAFSGFLAERIGYGHYFLSCTLIAIPSLLLLFVLPKKLTGRV